MGVSFKVSKTGTRFRPKPVVQQETAANEVSGNSGGSLITGSKNESSTRKGDIIEEGEDVSGFSSSSILEHEVSFTLNLYPNGFSIGKPSKNEAVHQATRQDVPKLLHPYDRTSETLFSAIESGRLPGDILDDIPCKYINGSLICEVRDYRKCASEQDSSISCMEGPPIVNKVHLRMSLENVVKDIPSILDDSWTYGDLMEVESRILKALQPQLCLDPTPKLDRLCNSPDPTKLHLALSSLRRKRLRQTPEVSVMPNNRMHGKKICIDRVPESSNSRFGDSGMVSGNAMSQNIQENLMANNLSASNLLALRARSFTPDNIPAQPLVSQQSRYQMGVGATPRNMQDQGSGSLINISGNSPSGQDMMIAYGENVNSGALLHGKRENQDVQMTSMSSFNKRARCTQVGPDGSHQQQLGPHVDGLHSSDMNWKKPLMQQQPMARGIQYANAGIPKYPQQMFDGVTNQNSGATQLAAGPPGMRFAPKEEQYETEKLDASELSHGKNDMQADTETGHLDKPQSRLQQRLPQQMRLNFPQATWNNLSQDSRREEHLQQRKSVQSPQLSTGALAQSPLQSKSGELSSGSAGPQFGAVAATVALGSSQKERSAVTSVPAVGVTQSLTSSACDSLQRQQQARVAAKARSNSLPMTPIINGIGSPASVSTINATLNVSSPSVGTPPMADHSMLERFSKIEMVTMRHQLNCKKNKVDGCPVRKSNTYSHQELLVCLSNSANNEDFKDDGNARQLSKSLVGGSMNMCKMRVINFIQEDRIAQGAFSCVPRIRNRMIMSEKPNDGTVAILYGEVEDGDILSADDYLPTLPNTHFADLLAAQFCSLMIREGYLVEDHIELKPTHTNVVSCSLPVASGAPPNNSAVGVQQFNEIVPGQPSNEVKPTLSGIASLNQSQNLPTNTRMLPPGNPQALQMSQGLLSGVAMPARPQQLDPQPPFQQQQPQQQQQQQNPHTLLQQQHSQFQRSPMVLPSNPLASMNAVGQNSNMQVGNHIVNKASLPLRLQQQQQPPQQQQPQMQQRRMMMGLGTMGMGNVGNNMVGLGGLGNAIGVGGARGMGPGISGPMAPISGITNVGHNPMTLGQTSTITNAISQQLRSGHVNQAHATLLAKFKMAHNRTSMLGGPQAGMAGISGAARQMQPGSPGLSMLGQSLNRANMSSFQRSATGPMGPPKLMTGMNLYVNQQQLQLQQLQQQQQQQQYHQQIQQQLQQQQQFQPLQQLQQQPPHQPQLQQQETTSSLQSVVSPSQVGSPSTMGIPQLNQQSQQQQPLQQPSPQQMSQRTPMSPQISSGGIHTMSAGNPEACPASPQLSSQTLGSVGSITNSPMELQAVNKSNSVSNGQV